MATSFIQENQVIIEKELGSISKRSFWTKSLLFFFLDLCLLRSWYLRKELKKWGSERVNEHMHILDGGSGFGQNSNFLTKLSPKWSIIAMDLRAHRICECNSYFHKAGHDNVRNKVGSLESMDDSSCYDLVLLAETLRFIKNDRQVLENCYNSLKLDGTLLISVPTLQGNNSDVSDLTGILPLKKGYSMKELKKLLSEVGFSGCEYLYHGGKLGSISEKIYKVIPNKIVGFSKALKFILPLYFLITFPFVLILNYLDSKKSYDYGSHAIMKAYKR